VGATSRGSAGGGRSTSSPTLLGLADLFPVEPIRESARDYRRWAFESAALDLALRQSGLSLQDAIGRAAQPVNFVVSTRIADSSGVAALRALHAMDATLRFKLDPTPSWDDAVLAELASLEAVDVVDMKGLYRNATVAIEPDPDLYRRVFEALPEAWIEDPAVADDTIELLDRHRQRITWDVPVRSVGDIEALPWPPGLLNLKPARFGSLRRLFETYDYRRDDDPDQRHPRRDGEGPTAHPHHGTVTDLSDRPRAPRRVPAPLPYPEKRERMSALTGQPTVPGVPGPSDVAEIERIPLAARSLPASTYELVSRAAPLEPDRPGVSVPPDPKGFHAPVVRTFAELARDVLQRRWLHDPLASDAR
jgi:hypothetical protein